MEIFDLNEDIKVFCITATSFPDGILDAHERLHGIIPFSIDRKYFGISRPENNLIIYKAAVEELPNESRKYDLEPFLIKKGKYISTVVENYAKEPQDIRTAFEKLTSYSGIESDGYCIEWYINDSDVRCMIRLED